jgi:hypothetical protein
VACGPQVEVESRVDAVVVDVAHALALHGGEAEAGADRAVHAEPPMAHVAIPAGLHLADEHDPAEQGVDPHTEEVPGVGAGVRDRQRRAVAQPEARCGPRCSA